MNRYRRDRSRRLRIGFVYDASYPETSGGAERRYHEIATRLAEQIRRIPGAVDVRVQQPDDLPKLKFDIDRTKAAAIGLSEKDVANAVLLSVSARVAGEVIAAAACSIPPLKISVFVALPSPSAELPLALSVPALSVVVPR